MLKVLTSTTSNMPQIRLRVKNIAFIMLRVELVDGTHLF